MFRFDISVIAKYDARVYLVWTLLGIIFFLRSLYYKGEVIDFRLFRATGYIIRVKL